VYVPRLVLITWWIWIELLHGFIPAKTLAHYFCCAALYPQAKLVVNFSDFKSTIQKYPNPGVVNELAS
jgi:hypothetical protein